jgi:hypothetical protein
LGCRNRPPGNEDLPKLYAKTREYRSAVANKAVKTRRKNEAANASGEPTPGKKSASRRSAKAKAQAAASTQPVAPAQPAASDTPNPAPRRSSLTRSPTSGGAA